MVWGGHASRSLVTFVLVVHIGALLWLCGDPVRLRLIGYDFTELSSEALVNDPPDRLRALGYTEDDPAAFSAFRTIAQRVAAGSASDADRMRRLGDYIYSLRRDDAPDLQGGRAQPLSRVWSGLQRGEHGSCGEMSMVLGAFWRSLGGHSRAVRWATAEGIIGHNAIELYSPEYGRWVYYDMNLNGYSEDDDGTPMSIASLRSNLLTNEDVHPVASAQHRDWNFGQFRDALQAFPVEWYVLNNRPLYFEADRRFGRLKRFAWLVNRMPTPLDRILDNLAGERDRRIVVEGKIQIADLFTFEGARWMLAYLAAMTLLCGATLGGPPLTRAVRRRLAVVLPILRRGTDVRFRDAAVPSAVIATCRLSGENTGEH